MESPTLWGQFDRYIKPGFGDWIDLGLVDDAPESAKKAYEQWVKEERERIEQGIEL